MSLERSIDTTDARLSNLWMNGDSQVAQHMRERSQSPPVGVNLADYAFRDRHGHQAPRREAYRVPRAV